MNKKLPKKDALDTYIDEAGIDADRDSDFQQFSRQIKIAEMIYAARKQAGLTQAELAKAVGTKQQVISQLESADYEGHSFSMLERIASALHSRIEIRIVPEEAEVVG
ncbi:helix-turn-helix domain-containing protein [Bythopirellula goksoeyrii]|uniref:Antitoxin HipB n=1 Tax=Bythopirellula goksoeyrii TaxID=1400387 RepID=A0A5B9QL71_9BACT|nr:helix-turn-helix transcriptional regulator [Bythopirellula goksoeyrii]QEG37806.1 antitoxin HipB [Bythopirellula goksoeyrii]